MKCCSAIVHVLCLKPPTVGLNDRAGNGQAHAHALRLGGEKRIEDVCEFVRGNAVTGVANCDLNSSRSVEPGGDIDAPSLSARPVDRIHGVENEVEQYLLNVHAIAKHGRQIAGHLYVRA